MSSERLTVLTACSQLRLKSTSSPHALTLSWQHSYISKMIDL